MYLMKALAFGTEGHPEKVAQRLRVLNFACWVTAPSWLAFAILYFPEAKLRTIAMIDRGDRRGDPAAEPVRASDRGAGVRFGEPWVMSGTSYPIEHYLAPAAVAKGLH